LLKIEQRKLEIAEQQLEAIKRCCAKVEFVQDLKAYKIRLQIAKMKTENPDLEPIEVAQEIVLDDHKCYLNFSAISCCFSTSYYIFDVTFFSDQIVIFLV